MFSSDKKKRSLYLHQVLVNLSFTLFFALFGAVYEIFSHEVYSYYMIYAFAVPLVLGVLPFSILQAAHPNKRNGRKSNPGFFLWNCGILTLTVGCAFKGVLDIYGTTNRLLLVYPATGLIMLAAGGVLMTSLARSAEKGGIRDRFHENAASPREPG